MRERVLRAKKMRWWFGTGIHYRSFAIRLCRAYAQLIPAIAEPVYTLQPDHAWQPIVVHGRECTCSTEPVSASAMPAENHIAYGDIMTRMVHNCTAPGNILRTPYRTQVLVCVCVNANRFQQWTRKPFPLAAMSAIYTLALAAQPPVASVWCVVWYTCNWTFASHSNALPVWFLGIKYFLASTYSLCPCPLWELCFY